MTDTEKKKLIYDFIHRHKITVISTVTPDAKPSVAVIEFGESEDLELIFDTPSHTRKYKNLQTNQDVAFVIGWDEDITVQYEGVAQELSADESAHYQQLYFSKNHDAARWLKVDGARYFKVKPTWIRYSDVSVKPWKILEVSF